MLLSNLITVATTLITSATAKNILLTNDDGWAATNIRALYRDLRAEGHNVVMVAPAVQMSGNGGKIQLPQDTNLPQDALFDYPPAGSPSWGHEVDDMNVWYFNGTPAACVMAGLDYIIPNYFNNMTIDLVLSGPNEGDNMGERDFVLSGTVGSIYYAIERGYPGIALSGANGNNSFFKDNLSDDPTQAPNINSRKTVELVNAIFDKQGDNPRALPFSTGLNVNFSPIGSDITTATTQCDDLTFIQTRMTGSNAQVYEIVYNSTTNLVSSTSILSEAVENCLAGDCSLPSDFVVTDACYASITVFSIDADVSSTLGGDILSKFDSIIS
ncbi:hypothetical protein CANARDRAFT_24902 [[Candida] arabinofermentans NRRL YB-2248]|uniref:Survival protein SurE-like phosphatase/nucleotidase domain-containing protein n=1 Tax=[Candida] arabinofermentans NRRL YB-2248 TaxID=983967 RepID=A0A1E4SVY4_9ASCO|nr:hypothetical protein CANARDRAFT_24902 [[Candida] arabinofermentans NRRL YB-2248]